MRNKMSLQLKKLEVIKLNNNHVKDVNQIEYFNQAFKMLNFKPFKKNRSDNDINIIFNIYDQIHFTMVKQEYADIFTHEKYHNFIESRVARIEELQGSLI